MRRGFAVLAGVLLLSSPASAQGSSEWGSERQVSNTGGYSSGSVGRGLTVDSRGYLHVLWTEVRGSQYDVLYARSTDGGGTWSPGVDLSNSTLPAMGGNIAIGPDDTLHAAWADRRQGGNLRIYYSRSFNSGASWETPRDVSGDRGNAATPSISVDTRQRVHIVAHRRPGRRVPGGDRVLLTLPRRRHHVHWRDAPQQQHRAARGLAAIQRGRHDRRGLADRHKRIDAAGRARPPIEQRPVHPHITLRRRTASIPG